MTRWGEIKCPRCAELEAKLRESALQELSALGQASEAYQAQKDAEAKLAETDALWEGMERALEESDAREARLERWLAESETREAALNDRITMLEEHLCLTEAKLAEADGALNICSASWGECNRILDETKAKLAQQDDDFYPATAGDDPIYLGGVEYITRQRSDDLVQAAILALMGYDAKAAGAKDAGEGFDLAISMALAAIREGGE